MNLYLLKRSDHVGYDETAEMVVAAESAAKARTVASGNTADENPAVWLDSAKSTVRIIGTAKTTVAGVVIRDIMWG